MHIYIYIWQGRKGNGGTEGTYMMEGRKEGRTGGGSGLETVFHQS
jgi:hypothetical protein